MIKKYILGSLTVAVSASCLFFTGMNANAASVDDVAAVARSYGYSEDMIQAGYNEYYTNPDEYPPERLDKVIRELHAAGSQIVTTGPQVTNVVITTVNTTTVGQQSNAQTTASDGYISIVTTVSDTSASSIIVLTTDDGETFERISEKDFIALSYDDKMKYISSFTPAQQQAIINNLSPEEYKSILKQSPIDKKTQVVDKLSDAAEDMGLNITIDEISGDSLTVSMRNEKGELINRTSSGTVVENTGYNRTPIFAAAGAMILAALGTLFFLMRYSFRKSGRIEGINEK